jgi:hypothetical protein
MVNKAMEHHFFLAFNEATTIIATFYIWMSQGGFDTFDLVVNYDNNNESLVTLLQGSLRFKRHQELPWFCNQRICEVVLISMTKSKSM